MEVTEEQVKIKHLQGKTNDKNRSLKMQMIMDYKYIEQLLERYWNCETSLEEEDILRTFFSQKDIPAELLPYQALFAYGQTEKKANVLETTSTNESCR